MTSSQTNSSKLSREQKTGFALLLIFALLTAGLTFLQMRNTIYSPFVIHTAVEKNSVDDLYNFDETTRLQQIDTDQDGLNDYEELYFYETSPYIPDTDSDGIDDATELQDGTDPLCPQGQTCGDDPLVGLVPTTTLRTSLGGEVATPQDIVSQFDPSTVLGVEGAKDVSTDTMNAFLTDPQALRQLLLSSGKLSEEQLKGITDDQLLSIANQSATQIGSE